MQNPKKNDLDSDLAIARSGSVANELEVPLDELVETYSDKDEVANGE